MYTLEQVANRTITVRAWDGTEGYGKVYAVHADIKNGRPGVDFRDSDGGNRWAYLSQVTGIFND
jgi:hypothetical protein